MGAAATAHLAAAPAHLAAVLACLATVLAATTQSLAAQEPAQALPLSGRILDADDSRPIAGARVEVRGAEDRLAATDAEGRFRIARIGPGSHPFRVQALGYRTEEGTVKVGSRGGELVVSLVRQPLLASEIIATGTPLRGVAPYQPGQAFDAEELSIRAANSFGEMLDGEPGLAMRSFGPAAGRPVIRGLDGDRVAVLESGQRMGDMSETAHDHAIAVEPLLAERVEVVRGPASLLYGSSALGGVVNILRQDVPADWRPGLQGTLAAQAASVNRLGAAAGSARYGSDRWVGSGRWSIRDSGDFRAPGIPGGTLESTHSRLRTGAGGFAWVSDALRAGAAVDLHGHVYGVPEELDDPDDEVEIRSGRQRLSGVMDWRRPERLVETVELRVAGARFLQQEIEREWERDGSLDEEIEHEFHRYTADASLTANHGRLGPFEKGAVGASALVSALAARGAGEFHPDGSNLALALFAFEQLPVTERVSLQSGFRLEQGRTVARENDFFPGFHARRSATTVSGAIGARARPIEGIELGAQIARAHRTPLLEQLYSDGPHLGAGRFEIGDSQLGNEVGHGLDLFARYAGVRLEAEVALFRNWIDDYVFPRPTGHRHESSGLPTVRWSAAAAVFTGGEIALGVRTSPHLRLRATFDYVRANEQGAGGEPLPFIPPARGSLTWTYDRGGWWIGGRTRGTARQDRVPSTQEPTEGYALLDAQMGLRLGDTREHALTLRIDNALDTVYRDHLSRVDERRHPMPGRNLVAVYRWSF